MYIDKSLANTLASHYPTISLYTESQGADTRLRGAESYTGTIIQPFFLPYTPFIHLCF